MRQGMRNHLVNVAFGTGLSMMAMTGSAFAIESCVASLKKQAVAAGVRPDIAERMLSGATFDEKVIRFSTSQPEHKTEIWDYMAFLVDAQRIQDGKANLKNTTAHSPPSKSGTVSTGTWFWRSGASRVTTATSAAISTPHMLWPIWFAPANGARNTSRAN